MMTLEQAFIEQYRLYKKAQKNKRRGHDSVAYEMNWAALTIRGTYARLNRTLRISTNYAFLTSLPRWREIMATEYEGRKIDHEICDLVIPLADKVLSPYTFNNRKGMGSMAAINQLIENIAEVTEGYTKPARIIKLDFSGYFPNAMWDYAEKCINEIIDMSDGDEDYKNYLRWLTMISIHCNPAAHCELRTPWFMWGEHIAPEKSILTKPEGIGAAIGRLIWQTAMGLYINDIIEWLTDDCGIKVVCFVDDIVMVVPEERHQYALSLIPELRKRLAPRNVRLNEKKFYDQPYQHGVEFLGSHIKTCRLHINNKTYGRAIDKVNALNNERYKDIDKMQDAVNSYSGLIKNRTDYHRLMKLIGMIDKVWWQWFEWDARRLCLVCKEGFTKNERLNNKYHLNLKKYDTRRKKRAA